MYVNSINFFSRRVTEPPFEEFPQQRHSILLAAPPIGGAIVEYGSVWHLRSPCTSHRLLGGDGTKPSYLYNQVSLVEKEENGRRNRTGTV